MTNFQQELERAATELYNIIPENSPELAERVSGTLGMWVCGVRGNSDLVGHVLVTIGQLSKLRIPGATWATFVKAMEEVCGL